jgi:type III restriction enzyme
MSLENIVRSVSGRLEPARATSREACVRLHWAVDQVPALRDSKARSAEELKDDAGCAERESFRPWPTSSAISRPCAFALATGVGKTRLMGAFISYLHAAYGYKHFFVLGAEPDHLRQADRRLLAELAQVCVQGHR